MTKKLEQALIDQKSITKPENQQIAGWLGIPLGGQKRVEVIGRNSYVYVRLRSNQSEVIQAYNNKVAASYNLPVLVERDGNRYVIATIDTKRYDNNWNSQSPFLPIHGHTHSFDVEGGGGGDPVWVQSRQFTPLLSLPSGSVGAGGVVIDTYLLENQDGSWKYVGGTGSPNISIHRPTSPTGAIMALVYLDSQTGNPQIIVNSGTVFSNTITGSSQLAPYIPSLPSPTTQIPLAAIRLISGTSILSWDNIYDARQWLHVNPSGSAGGLSSIAIQDEGVPQGNATTFNFVGSGVQATISGSVAQVNVSGGGGSINTGVLDQRYLKLDASNDPIVGHLDINSEGNLEALSLFQYIESGTVSTSPVFRINRVTTGSASYLDYPIKISDHSAPFQATGTFAGTIFHICDQGILIDINPYTTGTLALINSQKGAGKLISLQNKSVEKLFVDNAGRVSNSIPRIPGGRVSLSSGSSVMTSDFADVTSIFYVPHINDVVSFWDGSLWKERNVPAITELKLCSTTGSVGFHQSGKVFDLFLYVDVDTVRLVSSPAWTNDTTPSLTLELINGVETNSANFTGRYGSAAGETITVPKNLGVHVGTFYASANGQTTWELGGVAAGGNPIKLYLWNRYNRVDVACSNKDDTDTWTYTTATYRSKNNSTSNRASFVRGANEDLILIINNYAAFNTNIGTNQTNSVGLDSTSTQEASVVLNPVSEAVASNNFMAQAVYNNYPGLGFHFLQIIERGAGVGTTTFIGDAGQPDVVQTGFVLQTKM